MLEYVYKLSLETIVRLLPLLLHCITSLHYFLVDDKHWKESGGKKSNSRSRGTKWTNVEHILAQISFYVADKPWRKFEMFYIKLLKFFTIKLFFCLNGWNYDVRVYAVNYQHPIMSTMPASLQSAWILLWFEKILNCWWNEVESGFKLIEF